MKFCCASNAAFKNVKIERKAINFFPKIFLTNSPFFQKVHFFLEKVRYLFDSEGSSRHFDHLFSCFGLIVSYELTIYNIMLNPRKIMKIMSTFNFKTPLAAKS